ncbi:hypothetical protein [Paramagnetospirillum magneticum]|uniref:Uncharacterized protein n=1 Tax=Paramagnetospirillum magneticum (strain ATCC 700264 / AMB-1) TaxID=342108 RepID=Q2W6L2_PARM1|nr:hypothetical protein [Paramagnetospirillum magneticum]BAE50513.1 hypothetical protein amb1709 [Paramagnetospirillum magneticum AMB-1]
MKTLMIAGLAVAAVFLSTEARADSWTCYRVVDGKGDGGFVKVDASSQSEAAMKAVAMYRDMGKKVDSADCRRN